MNTKRNFETQAMGWISLLAIGGGMVLLMLAGN